MQLRNKEFETPEELITYFNEETQGYLNPPITQEEYNLVYGFLVANDFWACALQFMRFYNPLEQERRNDRERLAKLIE